jgi:hypothetical protein
VSSAESKNALAVVDVDLVARYEERPNLSIGELVRRNLLFVHWTVQADDAAPVVGALVGSPHLPERMIRKKM